MAAYYVISAQNTPSFAYSNTNLSGPTSDQIVAAFNSVNLYSGAHWVDPGVRIVRLTNVGSTNQIFATRVLAIDDPTTITGASTPGTTTDQAANFVAGEIGAALSAQSSDWSPATFTPFSAANGDISWWQSGQSDITQTRDQTASVFSSNVSENPTGPTSNATHPNPVNLPTLPTLPQLDLSLGLLVIGGIVVLALIYAPEIKGLAGMFPKAAPAPRALPSRSSSRRRRARATTQKSR